MSTTLSYQFNGLVLAGGRSTRMGQDKALLMLGNGKSLLQNSVELLRSAGSKQIFYSHPDLPESCRISASSSIEEHYPNQGPVSGIQGALALSSTIPLLVLPVDMPLLSAEMLKTLVKLGNQKQENVYYKAQCMPVYIHNPVRALEITTQMLQSGLSPAVWRVLDLLNAKAIDTERETAFKNANDPAQWQECLDVFNSTRC